MQADMFGHKVVVTNATEGAAYGVALLAAVGAGAYKNIQEACKATIAVEEESKPDKKVKAFYDKAFPVYPAALRDRT